VSSLISQELKVKSDSFQGDQKKGISVFTGHVDVTMGSDKLKADKVVIYTDSQNQPTKFEADGNSAFSITTEDGSIYKGKAGRIVYIPNKKEYRFFKNVHLNQTNDKKEIIGEEVILNTVDGKAYAKGAKNEPVIMIFNIADKKKK
jgi:lipopolysaccharide export system protein LptA